MNNRQSLRCRQLQTRQLEEDSRAVTVIPDEAFHKVGQGASDVCDFNDSMLDFYFVQ